MMSDELNRIVEELKAKGTMRFLDGVDAKDIDSFEKEHSVTFPAAYREWLQFSDGGECFLPAGVQFYGIAHKPLIEPNNNDRPDENYTVIGALASGDPILCKKYSDEIAIYNHEAGKIEEDEKYSNFFVFLNSLYEDILGLGVDANV